MRDGTVENAPCRSPHRNKKGATHASRALRSIKKAYFLVVSAIAAESFLAESAIAAESIIFMPVSMAAGAGAIAAPVSTGASSFFVQAARARTAATRAMRFICNLQLERGPT